MEVSVGGCVSLRAAVVSVSFWQVAFGVFSFNEAIKFGVVTKFDVIFVCIALTSATLSFVSAFATFCGFFKRRKSLIWTYVTTLVLCAILWTASVFYVAVFSEFNNSVKILSIMMGVPALIGNICFAMVS
eukprot:GHVL01008352.1.p1 GENE.GHVL01008352.1~~GHVL01008352.1.p1  ORF type:complete len:130 (+),score=6.62 GHVL01008352.1:64-453(+)